MQTSSRFTAAIVLLVFAVIGSVTVTRASATGGIDFAEMREQALFAAAAYRDEAAVRAMLEGSDFRLTLWRNIPGIEVAFFVATDARARRQVVAVRGTANVENAMLDVALKLRLNERTGLFLHEGFALAADRVYEALRPVLEPGYEIRVTGHSLGGAVATILAAYLAADGMRPGRTITFGQPKVTNVAGAAKIGELGVLRVVEEDDLVPVVPLFDPLDINNVDLYWHAGTEVVLLDGTHYALLEGTASMMRATRFTQKPLTEEHLHKHDMAAYLALIDRRLSGAEQVSYKTDLNLFNLFGGGE